MKNILDIEFRWIIKNDEKILQYRKKMLETDYSTYYDDSEYHSVWKWQEWTDVKFEF